MWAHLGLLGPPEASRGQTKQTVVGIKVIYGTFIGAGWKRPTCPEVIHHDNIVWRHPENTDSASSGPLEVSRGQTKQTEGGRKVVYGKLEQDGSVQRAQK